MNQFRLKEFRPDNVLYSRHPSTKAPARIAENFSVLRHTRAPKIRRRQDSKPRPEIKQF